MPTMRSSRCTFACDVNLMLCRLPPLQGCLVRQLIRPAGPRPGHPALQIWWAGRPWRAHGAANDVLEPGHAAAWRSPSQVQRTRADVAVAGQGAAWHCLWATRTHGMAPAAGARRKGASRAPRVCTPHWHCRPPPPPPSPAPPPSLAPALAPEPALAPSGQPGEQEQPSGGERSRRLLGTGGAGVGGSGSSGSSSSSTGRLPSMQQQQQQQQAGALRRLVQEDDQASVGLPPCDFGPQLNFIGSFDGDSICADMQWLVQPLGEYAPADLHRGQVSERIARSASSPAAR